MSAQDAALTGQLAHSVALHRGLCRLRLRLRVLLALRFVTLAAAATAGPAGVVLVLLRLLGRSWDALPADALVGLTVAAACVTAALWRLPDVLVASSADRRLGLRDRLGTAVRLLPHAEPTGMMQAAISDAAERIASVRPAEAYPVRPHRSFRPALASVCALVLVQTLPIPALFLSRQQRAERAELRLQAQALEPIALKLMEQSQKSGNQDAEKLARRMQRLAERFKQGSIGKKEALLALGEVQSRLKDLQTTPSMPKTAADVAEEMQRERSERVSSAARELAQTASRAGNKEAAQKLERLAEKARQAKDPAEAKRLAQQLAEQAQALGQKAPALGDPAADLAADLAGRRLDLAREELAGMKDALAGMSAEERQRLAEQLQEMSKGLSESDLGDVAKQLAEASKSLSQADVAKAQKALAEASKFCKGKGG